MTHTADTKHTTHFNKYLPQSWSIFLLKISGVLALLLVLIFGSYFASRDLTPASHFYFVKQFYQAKRIFLTSSPAAKAKVYMIQTNENLNELEQLARDHYKNPVPYVISANLFSSHQHSTGNELRVLKAEGVDIQPLVNEFCTTLNGYTRRFDYIKASSPKAAEDALLHAQKMTIENIKLASTW